MAIREILNKFRSFRFAVICFIKIFVFLLIFISCSKISLQRKIDNLFKQVEGEVCLNNYKNVNTLQSLVISSSRENKEVRTYLIKIESGIQLNFQNQYFKNMKDMEANLSEEKFNMIEEYSEIGIYLISEISKLLKNKKIHKGSQSYFHHFNYFFSFGRYLYISKMAKQNPNLSETEYYIFVEKGLNKKLWNSCKPSIGESNISNELKEIINENIKLLNVELNAEDRLFDKNEYLLKRKIYTLVWEHYFKTKQGFNRKNARYHLMLRREINGVFLNDSIKRVAESHKYSIEFVNKIITKGDKNEWVNQLIKEGLSAYNTLKIPLGRNNDQSEKPRITDTAKKNSED